MTQFASQQAHLDADVQALSGIFSQLEAQIAQLKSAVAAGGPVDFTAADQLVADGQAALNPPAPQASGEPDVSNVPSDTSTVQTSGAVVPPAPATSDSGPGTAVSGAGSDASTGSGADDPSGNATA